MKKKEEKNIKEIINLIKKVYGENFNKYIIAIVFTFVMKNFKSASLYEIESVIKESKRILT